MLYTTNTHTLLHNVPSSNYLRLLRPTRGLVLTLLLLRATMEIVIRLHCFKLRRYLGEVCIHVGIDLSRDGQLFRRELLDLVVVASHLCEERALLGFRLLAQTLEILLHKSVIRVRELY